MGHYPLLFQQTYSLWLRMNGTDTLMKHVKGVKHWRKIGKFYVNGQLRETFNPVGDPFVPKKPAKEVGVIDRYRDLKVAIVVFI
jgi:hypothetical protein